MEILEDKINKFLSLDNGKGWGYGNGAGNGDGYDNGNGYGNDDCNVYGDNGKGYGKGNIKNYDNGKGYGYGEGYGYGVGYGDGCWGDGKSNGRGISEINEYKVYAIDGIPTILVNVHGNLAQGFTLRANVILVPCYVAKVGNFFAHGKTAKEALSQAQEKYDECKPLDERIADTINKYPTLNTVVPHSELYILHHVLTGSCKFGRDEFAQAHNLDPDKGSMTMREFIELTRDAYGGDAIRQLEKGYELR